MIYFSGDDIIGFNFEVNNNPLIDFFTGKANSEMIKDVPMEMLFQIKHKDGRTETFRGKLTELVVEQEK